MAGGTHRVPSMSRVWALAEGILRDQGWPWGPSWQWAYPESAREPTSPGAEELGPGPHIHLRPPTLLGALALALGSPSPQSPASSSPLFPCARGKCLRQGDRGPGAILHSHFVSLGKLLLHICEIGHLSHLLAEGSRETLLNAAA